jgi:hypothetical protein
MAGPFKTQQEAVIEREKMMGDSVGYCPLARIDCVPRCVCYENARVRSHVPSVGRDAEWYAYGPYCNNQMFWGGETA